MATRKKYSEFSEERRLKHIARAYLNVYISRGEIKREPCQKCGNPQSEGHHEDYSKPLEVRWLCPECHREFHANDCETLMIPIERVRALIAEGAA